MFGLFSECKQMVKFTGRSFEIGTLKGPVQIPVSIGGISVKPELLQAAGQILQILDWLQYCGCKRIQSLKKLKDIDSKIVTDLILKQEENAQAIANLAVVCVVAVNCSSKKFEGVLVDWIASALPKTKETSKTLGNMPDIIEELISDNESAQEIFESPVTYREKGIKNELKCTNRKIIKRQLMFRKIGNESLLERTVSEAIAVTPSLSEAIANKKPFNLKKSIALLMAEKDKN